MSIPGGYPYQGYPSGYPVNYDDFKREQEENRQIWMDSVEEESSNARASLANQRAATNNQYQIGMAQVKNAADQIKLDKWYKGELVKLEKKRVEIEEKTLELKAEIDRGTLGLSAVETAAKMGGPENYFQYLDYLGGAREVPGMANWLGAVEGNRPQSGFNAPGSESMRPAAQTFGGMVEKLGGTTAPGSGKGSQQPASELSDYDRGRRERREAREAGVDPQAAAAAAVVKAAPPSTMQGWSPDDIRALDVLKGIYGAGAHKMAPNVYESLSPAQKALFASGGKKLGHDVKEFEHRYEQSRWGGEGVGAGQF